MPVPLSETDETVTFAKLDLASLAEAIEDVEARAAFVASRSEEKLPEAIVRRLCAGENPLRVFREHRRLSLDALAEQAGVSVSELTELEKSTEPASAANTHALARALGVDPDELLP